MRDYKIGDVVTRKDNGRRVRIVDVRPVGLEVFYHTEDVQDGHTVIISRRDVRPDSKAKD